MATLRLTKLKKDEPVRVNFDNVAYYYAKGENTVIVFVSPNHYEQTLVVKESLKTVESFRPTGLGYTSEQPLSPTTLSDSTAIRQ